MDRREQMRQEWNEALASGDAERFEQVKERILTLLHNKIRAEDDYMGRTMR